MGVPVKDYISQSAIFTICIAMLLDLAPRLPFTDEAGEEADLVRDVLALTNSGEAVFDCKGETIFRQRSYHYVLETITDGRIERGEIPHPFANVSPETLARVAEDVT